MIGGIPPLDTAENKSFAGFDALIIITIIIIIWAFISCS